MREDRPLHETEFRKGHTYAALRCRLTPAPFIRFDCVVAIFDIPGRDVPPPRRARGSDDGDELERFIRRSYGWHGGDADCNGNQRRGAVRAWGGGILRRQGHAMPRLRDSWTRTVDRGRDCHHQADVGNGHLQYCGDVSTFNVGSAERIFAAALTVDANASYLSLSDIASSGTPGNYTLTGMVAAFGKHVPTGTVSFLDTDSGNAIVATAALDPASLGFTLLPAPGFARDRGLRPQNTVLGDFNNDGSLDLAVTNSAPIPSVFYWGMVTEAFSFRPPMPPALPRSQLPAVTSTGTAISTWWSGNAIAATIGVLLGNGDGTFLPQQTYAVGHGPQSIAVADFDGDGFLDLAVLDRNDRNVTILLGPGGRHIPGGIDVCEDPAHFPGRRIRPGHCGRRLQWGWSGRLGRDRCAEQPGGRSAGTGRWNLPASGDLRVGFNPIGLAVGRFQ